jgi:hypothetical protein
MFKSGDSQAKALIGRIKHHLNYFHQYKTVDNRIRNALEIRDEWNSLFKLPISNFSPAVWDELNELMEEV